MSKCPMCKLEITEFNYEKKVYHWGSYDGEDWCEKGHSDEAEDTRFYCPECDEELFDNEEEANEFLKGLTPLQKIVNDKLEKKDEKL